MRRVEGEYQNVDEEVKNLGSDPSLGAGGEGGIISNFDDDDEPFENASALVCAPGAPSTGGSTGGSTTGGTTGGTDGSTDGGAGSDSGSAGGGSESGSGADQSAENGEIIIIDPSTKPTDHLDELNNRRMELELFVSYAEDITPDITDEANDIDEQMKALFSAKTELFLNYMRTFAANDDVKLKCKYITKASNLLDELEAGEVAQTHIGVRAIFEGLHSKFKDAVSRRDICNSIAENDAVSSIGKIERYVASVLESATKSEINTFKLGFTELLSSYQDILQELEIPINTEKVLNLKNVAIDIASNLAMIGGDSGLRSNGLVQDLFKVDRKMKLDLFDPFKDPADQNTTLNLCTEQCQQGQDCTFNCSISRSVYEKWQQVFDSKRCDLHPNEASCSKNCLDLPEDATLLDQIGCFNAHVNDSGVHPKITLLRDKVNELFVLSDSVLTQAADLKNYDQNAQCVIDNAGDDDRLLSCTACTDLSDLLSSQAHFAIDEQIDTESAPYSILSSIQNFDFNSEDEISKRGKLHNLIVDKYNMCIDRVMEVVQGATTETEDTLYFNEFGAKLEQFSTAILLDKQWITN